MALGKESNKAVTNNTTRTVEKKDTTLLLDT